MTPQMLEQLAVAQDVAGDALWPEGADVSPEAEERATQHWTRAEELRREARELAADRLVVELRRGAPGRRFTASEPKGPLERRLDEP